MKQKIFLFLIKKNKLLFLFFFIPSLIHCMDLPIEYKLGASSLMLNFQAKHDLKVMLEKKSSYPWSKEEKTNDLFFFLSKWDFYQKFHLMIKRIDSVSKEKIDLPQMYSAKEKKMKELSRLSQFIFNSVEKDLWDYPNYKYNNYAFFLKKESASHINKQNSQFMNQLIKDNLIMHQLLLNQSTLKKINNSPHKQKKNSLYLPIKIALSSHFSYEKSLRRKDSQEKELQKIMDIIKVSKEREEKKKSNKRDKMWTPPIK